MNIFKPFDLLINHNSQSFIFISHVSHLHFASPLSSFFFSCLKLRDAFRIKRSAQVPSIPFTMRYGRKSSFVLRTQIAREPRKTKHSVYSRNCLAEAAMILDSNSIPNSIVVYPRRELSTAPRPNMLKHASQKLKYCSSF